MPRPSPNVVPFRCCPATGQRRFLLFAREDADAESIEGRLKPNYPQGRCERAADLPALTAALQQARWDAVVACFDQDLSQLHQALALIRRGYPGLPVILIAGALGETLAAELLWEATWAFLPKSALGQLTQVIDCALRIADVQDEARQNQAEYSGLMDCMGDALFIHDDQGRFLVVNQQACDSLGYSRQELLCLTVADLDTEVAQTTAETIWRSLVPGEVHTLKGRHRRKDGISFPVEVRLQTLERQGVRHFIALVRDTSAHEVIEGRLRREREQQAVLRELLEWVLKGGDLNETLERCLRRVLAVSWLALLPKGGVFLKEPTEAQLRLAVGVNFSPEIRAACAQVPLGRCHCGRAAQQGKIQFATCVDERHEIRYAGMEDHGHYALPLLSEGAVLGVLVLYLPHGFQPDPVKEGFLASVADILANYICRKRQEDELVHHRQHLAQLVSDRTRQLSDSIELLARSQAMAHVGSWELDRMRNRLTWSDEVYRIFGITPQDFGATYEAFLDIVHPDDRAAVHAAYLASMRPDRTRYGIEHRIVRRDNGEVRVVQEKCQHERNAAGEVVRSIGMVQDITERVRAAEQMRIAAVAFESRDGMMVTDANRVILQVNRAFTQITGYSAEEAVGRTPALLRSGRHDDAFYRNLSEAIRYEGHWEGEIWNRRKNGAIYPEWLSITAVRNPAGAVSHYVGVFTDIKEPLEAQRKIIELAYYDPLTQLPNRRLLLDRLGHAIFASARHGRSGALLMIDLDNFKTLNDSRGHHLGDQLLQGMANRLQSLLRESDTAARLGGDEFVVLLENLDGDTLAAATLVEEIAEKLRAALAAPYRLGLNGDSIDYRSSVSIGITLFQQGEGEAESLLKQADLALYEAKAAGRNCIRFFDTAMQTAVNVRAAMETGLQRALANGELFLAYQPQVDSAGRVTGAEALLRWQPPGEPLVSPGVFIPIAEESGLILPIGRWVLETACRQLARWAQQPETRDLQLAVNVSARQFRQGDFVEQVLAALEATGAPPTRLKLELTESVVLKEVERVIDTLHRLRAAGVSFSLDDFGTGYSSLAYLKRLPLDQLKIDQGFVRGIADSPESSAIVKAVIALGHSLGLEVIAEGVETDEQRRYLAQEGCMAYQGYLFGRPGPVETVERMAGVMG